ncbi:MAG: lipoyl(octanoyl) transferase LipB [Balneolaceae bacterium]
MALPLDVYDIGRMDYRQAWSLQRLLQKRLIDQKLEARHKPDPKQAKPIPDSLLLTEHPHVYTLGKSGDQANLLKGLAELQQLDAEYIEIDRGGDITYHGPGQLVGYPILDLDRHFTDVHKYLRYLEEVIIRTCAEYGLNAGREEGLTGVWIGDRKICAMGIRCSRWVTMHGFALNVHTDLSYFSNIVPCGIANKQVTSLEQELGTSPDPDEVKKRVTGHLEDVFGVTATYRAVPPGWLAKAQKAAAG